MTTRFRQIRRCTVLAGAAISGGCQGFFEDLARQPYEDAMRRGRMTQGEYQRINQQIEQAANPPPPAARIPDKYK